MPASVLSPSLALLMRLKARAKWRRFRRTLKTPKGIIFTCLALGLVALMFGPSVVFSFMRPSGDPERFRSMASVYLLIFCALQLLSLKPGTGIVFFPPEVDFLFPGPYRRRELLIYKIAGLAVTSIGTGLFAVLAVIPQGAHWLYGYVGVTLAMFFIQLFGTSAILILANVAARTFTVFRKVLIAAVVLAVGMGLVVARGDAGETSITSVFAQFHDSRLGAVVLAPFEVLSHTIFARSFLEVAGWGTLSLLLNGLLILIILKLDANFLEASVETSRAFYERMQRIRRGTSPLTSSGRFRIRWRVPRFPWWWGAGPNIWRQCVSALRSAGGILIFVAVLGAFYIVPSFVFSDLKRDTSVQEHVSAFILGPLVGILGMMSLAFLPKMMVFDFRGDADRIETLKALPLSATAIVVGQLCAPIAFATALESLFVLALGFLQSSYFHYFVIAMFFLLPVNMLIFGLENLMFLLFPHRTPEGADMSAIGRQMILMTVRMMALVLACGIAGGIGWMFYLASRGSLLIAILVAWAAAFLLALALLPALVSAYRRFDPSIDTIE